MIADQVKSDLFFKLGDQPYPIALGASKMTRFYKWFGHPEPDYLDGCSFNLSSIQCL